MFRGFWAKYTFLARPLNLAAMSDLQSGVLSQNQEILHISEVSEICFFKKPHKWTEERRSGQRRVYSMDHCGTESPQVASQFKMAARLIKLQ